MSLLITLHWLGNMLVGYTDSHYSAYVKEQQQYLAACSPPTTTVQIPLCSASTSLSLSHNKTIGSQGYRLTKN